MPGTHHQYRCRISYSGAPCQKIAWEHRYQAIETELYLFVSLILSTADDNLLIWQDPVLTVVCLVFLSTLWLADSKHSVNFDERKYFITYSNRNHGGMNKALKQKDGIQEYFRCYIVCR